MFKIICITDRKSCREDFFVRLEKIASARPYRIILRDKELIEEDYALFAEKSMNICRKYEIPCSIHSYTAVAEELNARDIHLPLTVLRDFPDYIRHKFKIIGVSVHSAEEAAEAEKLGADYLIAGHIFQTDCKRDLPPRGLEFLKNVCRSVSIPVYAIGGISPENADKIKSSGAAGACIMSGFMKCDDPAGLLSELHKKSEEKNVEENYND